jgi:hypothetical protein
MLGPVEAVADPASGGCQPLARPAKPTRARALRSAATASAGCHSPRSRSACSPSDDRVSFSSIARAIQFAIDRLSRSAAALIPA